MKNHPENNDENKLPEGFKPEKTVSLGIKIPDRFGRNAFRNSGAALAGGEFSYLVSGLNNLNPIREFAGGVGTIGNSWRVIFGRSSAQKEGSWEQKVTKKIFALPVLNKLPAKYRNPISFSAIIDLGAGGGYLVDSGSHVIDAALNNNLSGSENEIFGLLRAMLITTGLLLHAFKEEKNNQSLKEILFKKQNLSAEEKNNNKEIKGVSLKFKSSVSKVAGVLVNSGEKMKDTGKFFRDHPVQLGSLLFLGSLVATVGHGLDPTNELKGMDAAIMASVVLYGTASLIQYLGVRKGDFRDFENSGNKAPAVSR